jgi:hypothetical protein
VEVCEEATMQTSMQASSPSLLLSLPPFKMSLPWFPVGFFSLIAFREKCLAGRATELAMITSLHLKRKFQEGMRLDGLKVSR